MEHGRISQWFYFGTQGQDGPIGAPGGWIEAEWPDHSHGVNGTFGEVENFERYVTSMYWAITVLSTVGFGEIHPRTTGEKVFVSTERWPPSIACD